MGSAEWLDPGQQAAWRGFLRSHAELSATLNRELLNESGLSIQDYGVLVALSESSSGRMRSFELGRILAWEKSRVSHHITRMVSRGLVTRVKCPTDQRGAFVEITPRGRKAIASAAPGHVASVRRYFVDLMSAKELETLTRITDKISSAVESSSACRETRNELDQVSE